MSWEAIIGLEVHAQLKTKTKMFCSCANLYGAEPNSLICPVCTAQPGSLPVVNAKAVELATRAGLALGGCIQHKSIFARKNYFYPDLTKNYQISQFDFPIVQGGELSIQLENKTTKKISITRIHMEEDAGKLSHDLGHADKSHVDYNRCGVPLIEIVSGPDIRSSEEAGEYLRKLRQILMYIEACEGNMKKGQLRCDANVSVRKIGTTTFNTRTEVKNLNSFKAVERAINFEIARQSKIYDGGGKVAQETLLWDDDKGCTICIRSKEEAHDYRYFPDPDLLPVLLDEKYISDVHQHLPELAEAKAKRFVENFGLPEYDAQVLTSEKALSLYFEACVATYNSPKKLSNWVMVELLRELNQENLDIEQCRIKPASLAELVKMIDEGKISGKMAKDVFIEMYKSGKEPADIVATSGMQLITDASKLEAVIDDVIKNNQKQLEQYKAGKVALFGYFVGQVMKATQGQADPKLTNDLLQQKLSS